SVSAHTDAWDAPCGPGSGLPTPAPADRAPSAVAPGCRQWRPRRWGWTHRLRAAGYRLRGNLPARGPRVPPPAKWAMAVPHAARRGATAADCWTSGLRQTPAAHG